MSMTPTHQKTIKLVAVYGRVSTSNQESEGTIESQLAAVRTYAHDNDYTIVQEYLDNGWSGDGLVRPALDQLRIDARKKIWEGVLIYDPDRLARRYYHQELVLDELREAGVPVLFVTTPQPKDETDRLLFGVKGVFAEYERAKITERFRMGKIRKVREGHVLTTVAPYGYTYIRKQDKQHGYYEINEDEARVVRMMFRWIADNGFTIRRVVTELQKLDIKPRKSKRGVWNTSTLSTLLRNKAYIGEAHWGSSYAVVPERPLKVRQYKKIKKTSRRMRPEEEWIAAKIPVPIIIERALFEKAREQLKTNFAFCQRNKKNQYLLAGKIRCVCGKTRGGEGPQHGKHLYYRCNDRNYSFPLPATCKERGINARIADKLVWDKLSRLMTSPDLIQRQLLRWKSRQHINTEMALGDTKTMETEIFKLKSQEDRYNKAYGAGLYSMDKLKEYTLPLRDQIASLEGQIAKAKQQKRQMNDGAIPDEGDIKKFTEKSTRELLALSFDEKRAIVTSIVGRIVGTQKELDVSGHMTLDLFSFVPALSNHVEYKTSYRNSWTSKRR